MFIYLFSGRGFGSVTRSLAGGREISIRRNDFPLQEVPPPPRPHLPRPRSHRQAPQAPGRLRSAPPQRIIIIIVIIIISSSSSLIMISIIISSSSSSSSDIDINR